MLRGRGGFLGGRGRRRRSGCVGAGADGQGGNCVCPSCGFNLIHRSGIPCSTVSCPYCGARMIRQ